MQAEIDCDLCYLTLKDFLEMKVRGVLGALGNAEPGPDADGILSAARIDLRRSHRTAAAALLPPPPLLTPPSPSAVRRLLPSAAAASASSAAASSPPPPPPSDVVCVPARWTSRRWSKG